ncbi:MAG: 30S ribosomal protein S20 [Candidatus Gygaella obscura]|nr:30S ribosomal protein S20 [Candidatus Gygaella obscura]
MPQRYSALKELRKSKKRNVHNVRIKNQFKKSIKQFRKLIDEKKVAEAKKMLPKITSQLTKAAKKNIIPKNTATRKSTRLQLLLNKTHS